MRRTTVNLDPQLVDELRDSAVEARESMDQTVNRLLRLAILVESSDPDGQALKLSRPLDEEPARRWLLGEGDPLALQTEVFNRCLQWLIRHPLGLTSPVLEEIARTALTEVHAAFRTHNLSVHDALTWLQRSLNRLRAREARRLRRSEAAQEEAEGPRENEAIPLLHWHTVQAGTPAPGFDPANRSYLDLLAEDS